MDDVTFDAEYIVNQIEDASPEVRDRLVRDLADALWATQRASALDDAKQHVNQRILSNGAEVTTDGNGAQRGFAGGKSQFDVLNFSGSVSINANNPRQADISMGAGADCMFDFLVSTCFATLLGFTEGQVFTSLSGCTFKGYSTVGGAVTQANTDFPALSGLTPTIAICSGTYTENNITVGSQCSQRWLGTGRDRTLITAGGAASIANPVVKFTLAGVLSLEGVRISAATHSTSTGAGVLLDVAASTLDAFNCTFEGGSTTDTTRAGIYATDAIKSRMAHLSVCNFPSGVGLQWRDIGSRIEIINCRFTGGNIGCTTTYGSTIRDCFFSSPVGIQIGPSFTYQVIENNVFANCSTSAIQMQPGMTNAVQGLWIRNNTFQNCQIDMDFSSLSSTIFTAGSHSLQISNNSSLQPGTAHIVWPAATQVWWAVLITNESITSGSTFETGLVPYMTKKFHNFAGTLEVKSTMYGNGVLGTLAADYHTAPNTIYWDSFYVFFGSTRVAVTPGSFAYGSGNTWYVSVNNAGVVTANTLGGFPAGEFPIAIVTTIANTTITTIDYYDGFLRTTAAGLVPASSGEAYVTIGNTAGLSAERALTAGAGISIVDGGANGLVTIASSMKFKIYTMLGEAPVNGVAI